MTHLSQHADVVIIGQGGIVGASVAHHLIEQGWRNIVGLDKVGYAFALAMVNGGRECTGETVYASLVDSRTLQATIVEPVFFDSKEAADHG